MHLAASQQFRLSISNAVKLSSSKNSNVTVYCSSHRRNGSSSKHLLPIPSN